MEKGEVAVLLNEDNTLGDVSAPSTSTSLETLQFKHDFFEVLEELQLRRQQDGEHKRRLQEILEEKYELEKKLEDSCMVNSQLVEEHKTEQEEIRHCYEEKMRTLQEEKAKASINSSCEDGQVSRLKDEIRALHLHKYNLEKTVSEQEHKLHLQTSSHEQFLSLVRQLEEKCTTLSQQVIQVNEHLDLLSNNVNEAIVINAKLEKQQKHHNCVVFSYQDELTSTKKELLKLTTQLSIDEQEDKMATGGSSNIKDLEQQLKMQWDTTALLEKQMEELQKENSSIASALKESSSLLEQQVDSYEQTKSENTSLQEQLTATKNHSEAISIELAEKSNDLTQLEKKHQQQEEIHSKKFADMEQRLRALQSDFMALQQSYESLQYDKQQWLKEKAEYTATVADKTEKITLLEEQLKKQLSDINPKPIVSTSKSPDLIKVVSVETTEDNSKRKCTEDDLPNNKRTCLSPSIISPSSTELPSSIHDFPAMPIPSSSHDPSVVSPPSISGDLPVKLLNTSSHEYPDLPLHSSLNDPTSPPSSHDLLTTPPSLHVSIIRSSPVDSSHLASHGPTATPHHVCDASIKPDTSSHDTMPSCLDGCDASQPHNSPTGLSSNPPVTTEQDQLEFSDLTSDIINTQLNQQIIEVQHFLKSDRLKRTKLPDTNTIQQ